MAKRRRRQDAYQSLDARSRAAKDAGYAARSVFKLEAIDRRVRLLRQGQRVLDLGAAPGSWSQYAANQIGSKGLLLAVDLKPLPQTLPPQCTFVQGDALTLGEHLEQFAPYDVVLSDMAPNTTGDGVTDKWRSYELLTAAAEVAIASLSPGGSFVGKIFMSGDFPAARELLRTHFEKVRTVRPEAVRSVSSEVFLVATGLQKTTEP